MRHLLITSTGFKLYSPQFCVGEPWYVRRCRIIAEVAETREWNVLELACAEKYE